MNWRPFDRETAPKDRPIAILSMQQTIAICQWHQKHHEFIGIRDRIGSGTHWCEVEELELPK